MVPLAKYKMVIVDIYFTVYLYIFIFFVYGSFIEGVFSSLTVDSTIKTVYFFLAIFL